MPRKITSAAINAFMTSNSYSGSNTKVITENGCTRLFLFGHLIAKRDGNTISITNAGYSTPTTKERLNGIPGVSIAQKKGVWYLNGEKWDGKWIVIE